MNTYRRTKSQRVDRLDLLRHLTLVLLLVPMIGHADIYVAVQRIDGDVVHVRVNMLAPCAPQVVWAVLTDYDDMAEYVPAMSLSQVESRTVSGMHELLRVRQEGYTEVGIFRFPIEAALWIDAEPYRDLYFNLDSAVDRFLGTTTP